MVVKLFSMLKFQIFRFFGPNKGLYGPFQGLNIVLPFDYHSIRCEILPQNDGQTILLAQIFNFSIFGPMLDRVKNSSRFFLPNFAILRQSKITNMAMKIANIVVILRWKLQILRWFRGEKSKICGNIEMNYQQITDQANCILPCLASHLSHFTSYISITTLPTRQLCGGELTISWLGRFKNRSI